MMMFESDRIKKWDDAMLGNLSIHCLIIENEVNKLILNENV
jgi:hypothetical protein